MDIYLNSSDYANFLRPPGPGHPDDLPAAPDLDYYYDSAQDWVSLRSPDDPVMTSWASWSPTGSVEMTPVEVEVTSLPCMP